MFGFVITQMTVLDELFKLWPQFLAFRSSVEDAQVLPLLESYKEAQQWDMKRQRERKQAQVRGYRSNTAIRYISDLKAKKLFISDLKDCEGATV